MRLVDSDIFVFVEFAEIFHTSFAGDSNHFHIRDMKKMTYDKLYV